MFHVDPDRDPRADDCIPELVGVPLFVNIPLPIRTDADMERAEVQELAA